MQVQQTKLHSYSASVTEQFAEQRSATKKYPTKNFVLLFNCFIVIFLCLELINIFNIKKHAFLFLKAPLKKLLFSSAQRIRPSATLNCAHQNLHSFVQNEDYFYFCI